MQKTIRELKRGDIAIWDNPQYGNIAVLCCMDEEDNPENVWPWLVILSKPRYAGPPTRTNGTKRGGFWNWGSRKVVSWSDDPCTIIDGV